MGSRFVGRLLAVLALAFVQASFAGDAAPGGSLQSESLEPATACVGAVAVRVAPDRASWTYAVGEPVRFTITASVDGHPLDKMKVRYTFGPEMMPATEHEAVLPPGGLSIDAGTLREPGFLRCVATVEHGGRVYRSLATAGFAPEQIKPTQRAPEDFDEFWRAGLAELASIPLEARRTLVPEACTDKVDVYHVSFRNAGGPRSTVAHSRIYGMLCVPKAPGRYPAVLSLPGAGVRPYLGWKDLAARGVITLQIGIHGIPVNLPQELYDQLSVGGLTGHYFAHVDQRERFYYRRVYLGCVRANDFLVGLPEYDGENLVVTGASQGGQLALVTAVLDRRVKAVAAYYPGFCDLTGYLHGRAGGWPHLFRPDPVTGAASPHATAEKIAVTAYYDVVNFARRLKVPACLAWGYNDETCPPTSLHAAFNAIPSPKRLVLALEQDHSSSPELTAAVQRWLDDSLRLKAR